MRANGAVEHEGRTVGLGGVTIQVHNLVGRREQPVIIQVEKGAKSGLAIQAMDRARLAGAEIINFSKAAR